ncbi:MAG: AbrB/MazE/SpoVT family DNA-binding domain-containing protein [Nanoarchaeota archaeon]|nr:AbrB/MazE/SpoVT family DNA-binding domain-containing protein [Nanoarchaeota archaeon]
MNIVTKTRKLGGSLIITIPKELVNEQNIREDELIEVTIKKKRKDYFGALKGIGSFTEEDELKSQLDE